MPAGLPHPHISIGMLLFPDLTQLDLTGPYEIFARMPNTTVVLVAETREPVRSEHGLTITPDSTLDGAPPMDVIFVPGGAGINRMMEYQPALEFLQKCARDAQYVTAVCTGSLLLGAAGLLKGYRATTHWLSLDLLVAFGAQPVQARVVRDRNRITGGGITAGMDFGLALAAELCGDSVAKEIQLMLEYDPQPPFQTGSPDSASPDLVQKVRLARKPIQDDRRAIVERAATRMRQS